MNVQESAPLAPLLSIAELAKILNVGRRTVERMISGGEIPRSDIRIGKLPRWNSTTVAAWIAKGGES